MNDKAVNFFALITITFAVLIVLTPHFLAPVCNDLQELKSGMMVHMKCYWVGQTTIILGSIIGIAGLLTLFSKSSEALKVMSILQIFLSAALILVTKQFIIGVCVKEMDCHKTVFFLNVWSAGLILASTVSFAKNRMSRHSISAKV